MRRKEKGMGLKRNSKWIELRTLCPPITHSVSSQHTYIIFIHSNVSCPCYTNNTNAFLIYYYYYYYYFKYLLPNENVGTFVLYVI